MNNEPNITENDIFFANYVVGYKGIPYNSVILLTNDKEKASLNLTFQINNNNYSLKIPYQIIKDIKFTTRTISNNQQKKVMDYNMQSSLISAAFFGGNPILQMAGSSVINSFLDTNSNNYNKVSYDIEYEIEIDFMMNNEEINLILNSQTSPEGFINQLKTFLNIQ